MKHVRFFLALLVLGLLSCGRDQDVVDGNPAPLAIYGRSFDGKSPSGVYDNYDYKVNGATNIYEVSARPHEFNYAPESEEDVDYLHTSVTWGVLSKGASDAEAFAFERIQDRNRKLAGQFETYRQRVIDAYRQKMSDLSYDGKEVGAAFITAYVRGVPSITADDVLFGQPAGSDLSQWVRFKDFNIIDIIGTDYQMIEKGEAIDDYLTAEEYFVQDKLLPLVFRLRFVDIPEEITPEDPWGKRLEEDQLIKLTVAFPVCYERYWEWCKALYTDPDAVEVFEDRTARIVISLIRKQ